MEPIPIPTFRGTRTARLLQQKAENRSAKEVRCKCPECGQHIAIRKNLIGQSVACPACAAEMRAPQSHTDRLSRIHA